MSHLQTALITGATSGIGFEFVNLFARDKINLVLVSRDEKKLLEIKKNITDKHEIDVFLCPCDLSIANSSKKFINIAVLKI